jgi:hypothetical protein
MDEGIFAHLGEWQDFDPSWLVRLAEVQHPRHPQVAAALQTCNRCRPESRSYIRFVDPLRPQQPDMPWQLATSLHLHDSELGPIVLDVLTNGRIGGVELLDRIEG